MMKRGSRTGWLPSYTHAAFAALSLLLVCCSRSSAERIQNKAEGTDTTATPILTAPPTAPPPPEAAPSPAAEPSPPDSSTRAPAPTACDPDRDCCVHDADCVAMEHVTPCDCPPCGEQLRWSLNKKGLARHEAAWSRRRCVRQKCEPCTGRYVGQAACVDGRCTIR